MILEEVLHHPIVVGFMMTLLNMVAIPLIGMWVRWGVLERISAALQPINMQVATLHNELSSIKAEQLRQNQEMVDHKRYANREFQYLRDTVDRHHSNWKKEDEDNGS